MDLKVKLNNSFYIVHVYAYAEAMSIINYALPPFSRLHSEIVRYLSLNRPTLLTRNCEELLFENNINFNDFIIRCCLFMSRSYSSVTVLANN